MRPERQTPELIVEKLKKIAALAQSGVAGERETAQRFLAQLLEKHHLTMEDITEERAQWKAFAYRNKTEKALLSQIVSYITQQPTISFKIHRRQLWYELTMVQALDVTACFGHYRKEYNSQLKNFFIAFIHRHNLFAEDGGPPKRKTKPMSPQQLRDIMSLMSVIPKSPWKASKAIAATTAVPR